MAGVTDGAFRLLCREQGCGLVCTEMVSAKALLYDNPRTWELLRVTPPERPVAAQLFGSSPALLAEAARRLEGFDAVDLNMGCPAPKVVKNGEGAFLMTQPALAGAIIKAVARATALPVTVKLRKGFKDGETTAEELAAIAEANGAAAVTVHGRTRAQFYSGAADWSVIRAVKRRVRIPVVGNGDVDSPEKAAQMLAETGCDAVMIGRAALGNPWLFRACRAFAAGGPVPPPPTWPEKIALALRHGQMLADLKGPRLGALEMRKHFCWYLKGAPRAAELRAAINRAESLGEMGGVVSGEW
jgi:nifR3 family TIM-barrel protein